MNMLKIQREQLYGGPMARGKRFHYVRYLNGEKIETGDTKEQAIERSEAALLAAFQATMNRIWASVAVDGTICTTREYLPGACEFTYHRGTDSAFCGSFMGECEIDGKPVSVRDYHKHYVAAYNAAVTPNAEVAA
jgi:hypothetical protein